ncbi:MAG: transposase domain-containing protein [Bryobacteraceae bacterium]
MLRSFVASCQRPAVDPFAWFKDVLSRIATHPVNRIAELLPHRWAAAQS